MSHPNGLPDLFLDRSLGRLQVAASLRQAGLRLVTLSEHYGIPADEKVQDSTWLEAAGSAGWVVFMKDRRIRWNRVEQDAVMTHNVKAFCLTRQDLLATEMSARFLDNLPAITRACSKPGPFIYAVHTTRIERLRIT